MKKFDVHLPIRNDVDEYKRTLLPTVHVENIKSYCILPELITQTVSALADGHELDGNHILDINSKFGIDCSGSHQVRHQLSGNDNDRLDLNSASSIGAFWCPLELTYGDRTLWTNCLPNSTLFSRPVCLMRAKETRDCIDQNFKPFLDSVHQLENSPIQIDL